MPTFRALYIERGAAAYEHGRALLDSFPAERTVWIESYKEVFARPGQLVRAQKLAPALIAAVGTPPFLYEAPPLVCGVSDLPVLYNAQLRTCVFDCDYCFLQGMHPSGHGLVFVNSERYHEAAAERAAEGDYWLSISYLSDVLAFERTLPLASEWIGFAVANPGVTVEIRSKGVAPGITHADPVSNVVLAWTITPGPIAARRERGAAPPDTRLRAAREAVERGWRVRLAFDPVLIVPGWERAYRTTIDEVFASIAPAALDGVSYGAFRMGRDYLARIVAARADTPIVHHPFVRDGSVLTYSPREIARIHEVVGEPLRRLMGAPRTVFLQEGAART